jgi:transcriptional regulator with XRE-family HTH domain
MSDRPLLDKPDLTPSAWIVSANLKKLMGSNEELGSNPKLGKKTGLGASAISRVLNGHNATLETVDRIGKAFGLPGWQLLIPDLDPGNLPVIQSAKEVELYRRLRELVKSEA